jgi:DNA mismatch endonuclease (patch repair protein)
MMSGIRGKNTAPELLLRKALHRKGFRYRLHPKNLPGKPDMVFPARKAVIMIHGCFWHGHDCHLFKWPSSRPDFWRQKIEDNRKRDRAVEAALRAQGWRILSVWECAIKGKNRLVEEEMIRMASDWLANGAGDLEIIGENHAPR